MVKLLLTSAVIVALISSVAAVAVDNSENVQAEALIVHDAQVQEEVKVIKEDSLIGHLLNGLIGNLLGDLPDIVDDAGNIVDNLGNIFHVSIGIGLDDGGIVDDALRRRPQGARPPVHASSSLARPKPTARPVSPKRAKPSESRLAASARHSASAIHSVHHPAH